MVCAQRRPEGPDKRPTEVISPRQGSRNFLAGNRALNLKGPPALSTDQRDAVLHATTADDLALIVGRAGAGKTTAARTIAAAYGAAAPALRHALGAQAGNRSCARKRSGRNAAGEPAGCAAG